VATEQQLAKHTLLMATCTRQVDIASYAKTFHARRPTADRAANNETPGWMAVGVMSGPNKCGATDEFLPVGR
jgi:hypothetical protein